MDRTLLEALVFQRDHNVDGNVYKVCQCDFAYHSDRIEGSTLTHDQTVQIFDSETFSGTATVDDIVEARNHFRAFDHVLDTWDRSLSPDYLCAMHRILKSDTTDAANPVMSVGEFKKFSNVMGALPLTSRPPRRRTCHALWATSSVPTRASPCAGLRTSCASTGSWSEFTRFLTETVVWEDF